MNFFSIKELNEANKSTCRSPINPFENPSYIKLTSQGEIKLTAKGLQLDKPIKLDQKPKNWLRNGYSADYGLAAGVAEIRGRRVDQQDRISIDPLPEKLKCYSNREIESLINLWVSKLRSGCKGFGDSQGSCLLTVLVLRDQVTSKQKLVCINLGDSTVFISKKDGSLTWVNTYLHCGKNPQEQKRVVEAGGKIIAGRINGDIEVTSSVGDFKYEKFMTCDPKISFVDLDEEDEIILACDGLTDKLFTFDRSGINTNAPEKLKIFLNQDDVKNATLATKATRLVREAFINKTTDNVSVMIAKHEGMYSVFDGHGGSLVSQYLSENAHKILINLIKTIEPEHHAKEAHVSSLTCS